MAYPTRVGQFILDADASGVATGAVLSQVQAGIARVIAYFCRALKKAERNYCVTSREHLAIVGGVRHFHSYLYGRKFLVRTDHGALRWLLGFKDLKGQLARWLEILGTYDYEVVYRSGSRHGNADALSRRPCSADECSHCERVEANQVSHEGSFCGAITWSSGRQQQHHPTGHNSTTSESRYLVGRVDEGGLTKGATFRLHLSHVIRWLESGEERSPWEQVSSLSPEVKVYWAQFKRLVLSDGILYRNWE